MCDTGLDPTGVFEPEATGILLFQRKEVEQSIKIIRNGIEFIDRAARSDPIVSTLEKGLEEGETQGEGWARS